MEMIMEYDDYVGPGSELVSAIYACIYDNMLPSVWLEYVIHKRILWYIFR